MRWLLQFRVCIIVMLAVILILAAISFSIIRAVLPYATGYKTEIETQLSQQIGLPVHIERIGADIHWFSPRLKLLNVTIYNAKNNVPVFHFDKFVFELDPVRSLLRWQLTVSEISLVGVDVSIERYADNRWVIQGMEFKNDTSGGMSNKLLYTLQHANYSLLKSNIYYRDFTKNKLSLDLYNVNIDAENYGDHHALQLSMQLPKEYGRSLRISTRFDGDLGSTATGKFYVEAKDIILNQWQKKFKWLPKYVFNGVLNTSIWGDLVKNKPTQLVATISASKFSFSNIEKKVKPWHVDRLSARLRLNRFHQTWRLRIANLAMQQSGEAYWPHVANISAGFDNKNIFINADFLRIQDIVKLARLGVNNKQLDLLTKITPVGDVYNLRFLYPYNHPNAIQLQGEFVNAGVTLPDVPAKISGIDADIHYRKNRLSLNLLTENAQIQLADLFRQPLHFDLLEGKAIIALSKNFNQDHGWSLQAPGLHIKNSHIDIYSRLFIRAPQKKAVTPVIKVAQTVPIQVLKKQPAAVKEEKKQDLFIDMQANFYDAYGKYAAWYMPVGIMDPALVRWLDGAVTDGYVKQGQFILHGNISDFPYKNNSGVMEVVFQPANMTLKFLDKWPAITDMSAKIRFYNRSMFITDATGKTLDGNITKTSVQIKNMEHPLLHVHASVASSMRNMDSYIRNSPLNDTIGNTLKLFQMDGDTNLDLSLDIPLYADSVVPDYTGALRLIHASWYYPELLYSLNDINGVFHFTRDSISAKSVRAKSNGQIIKLSARTIKKNGSPEVIFGINGKFNIDKLLAIYDWIPHNWLSGRSFWNISVSVPYKPETYLAHINAYSKLKGVLISASKVVSKPSAKPLPLSLSIDVLNNNGLHIDIDSKNLLQAYAQRDSTGLVGFTIKSGLISGKGSFGKGLNKNTPVKLRLDKLDLYSLLASKGNEQGSKKIKPINFPPLDWKVKTLLWNGWTFHNLVLDTDWYQHGMLINALNFDGPSMTLRAKGTWFSNWRYKNKTELSGSIRSNNMGSTLSGLGFEKSIDRGNLEASFNTNWQDEPYAVTWKNVSGKINFKLKDGQILEMNPGAGGRLLGLMNIFELTNRLSLDFGDVYRKGFSFDTINGELDFSNGSGKLEHFDVKAPSANIKMTGNVGLVRHDYDLLMRVQPHASGLTFAGGALLGGVAVGAGLAILQKVFNISLISDDIYTITGSWDKPVIKKIVSKMNDSHDNESDDGF